MIEKLKDYNIILQAFENAQHWNPVSLSEGYPGLLLLFSMKQLEDSSYEKVVHQYVLAIKEELETKGLSDLSMFSGATGICFSLQCASFAGNRYQKIRESLHDLIFQQLDVFYLKPLSQTIHMKRSSDPSLYDVVSGLSGVGGYALENLGDPRFERLSYQIAILLVDLCSTISIGNKNVPGWHLLPDNIYAQSFFKSLNGNFNLGLAHGVTGVLSFLSIALLRGVQVPGQLDVIQKISKWLCEWSINKDGMIRWPYHVSWEEEVGDHSPLAEPSRDGWCYGVPGISRVLYLAGKALSSQELKEFSMNAFLQLFNRSSKEWGAQNCALCHGLAGNLLIAKIMSQENEGKSLEKKVEDLQKELIASYEPQMLFGFGDKEQVRFPHLLNMAHPGFLEGVAGILLALLPLPKFNNKWYIPLMIHE